MILPGIVPALGSTEAEGRARAQEFEDHIIPAYGLAQLSRQSGLAWLRESAGDRTPTLGDVVRLRAKTSRVAGTPEQIADRLAVWRDAGVDGINVINHTIPGSYDEFIDHVLPVLRRRGLARNQDEPGTLRGRLFGRDRLTDRHPAARYRGAFRPAAATATGRWR